MRGSYVSYLKQSMKNGDYSAPLKRAYQVLALKASRSRGAPLPGAGPLHGSITVTYRCNLKCGMCYLWKGPSQYGLKGVGEELTNAEMKKVIDDFAALGTAGIGFTGGEPMLRTDMIDLITYTKSKGMITHMSCNGFLTSNKDLCKKIIESGLDAIGFSLDGVSAETHDKVRGKEGSYERVLKSIDNFIGLRKELNKDIKVIVVCVVSNYNVDELLSLIALLKERKVDHISFMPFHDIGLLGFKPENSMDFRIKARNLDKLNEVMDKIIDIKKSDSVLENSMAYLKLFKDCFAGKKWPTPCYAGYGTLAIGAWGHIYPCFPRMEAEVGKGPNVRTTPLKEFWTSQLAKKMRDEIRECRECYWNNQAEINLLLHGAPKEKDIKTAKSIVQVQT